MNRKFVAIPQLVIRHLALVAVGTVVWSATAALAGDVSGSADMRARYRQDLADCDSGKSHQDLASCRLEAKNAYAEARRGGFGDDASQYRRNALRRCDEQTGDAKNECEMRINGQGQIEGSVEGGGVLRSSTTIVPVN